MPLPGGLRQTHFATISYLEKSANYTASGTSTYLYSLASFPVMAYYDGVAEVRRQNCSVCLSVCLSI
jgi:hypothetical protein